MESNNHRAFVLFNQRRSHTSYNVYYVKYMNQVGQCQPNQFSYMTIAYSL